jgi:hypothetical protein
MIQAALFSACCILSLVGNIESSGKYLQADMWKGENPCYFADNTVACPCGTQLQHCHINIQLVNLTGTCVTHDKDTNLTEIGKCIYVGTREANHSSIDITSLCASEFHRTGTLCGECEDGLFIRLICTASGARMVD